MTDICMHHTSHCSHTSIMCLSLLPSLVSHCFYITPTPASSFLRLVKIWQSFHKERIETRPKGKAELSCFTLLSAHTLVHPLLHFCNQGWRCRHQHDLTEQFPPCSFPKKTFRSRATIAMIVLPWPLWCHRNEIVEHQRQKNDTLLDDNSQAFSCTLAHVTNTMPACWDYVCWQKKKHTPSKIHTKKDTHLGMWSASRRILRH